MRAWTSTIGCLRSSLLDAPFVCRQSIFHLAKPLGPLEMERGPRNGFLAATRDKRMEPFDNPKHNDYRFIMDRKAHLTWDHGAELCYEYDEIRVDTSDDNTRRECFVKSENLGIKQFNSTTAFVEERHSVVCKKPLYSICR